MTTKNRKTARKSRKESKRTAALAEMERVSGESRARIHSIAPTGAPAFQGDVMFRRVDKLPAGLTRQEGKEHVCAHSETGHHHVALGGAYYTSGDPFVAYLVTTEPVKVEHRRSTDTHETLELLVDGPEVVWEIRRQREHTPEGWRRVED